MRRHTPLTGSRIRIVVRDSLYPRNRGRGETRGRLLAVLAPRRDRSAVGRRAVLPAELAAAVLVLPFAALEPVVPSPAQADGTH